MTVNNSFAKYICLIVMVLAFNANAIGQEVQESTRREKIEEFAKFPGGADKFYEYVKKNLRYPADAQRDSTGGVVYVEFLVTSDGAIDKNTVKVIKSLSSSCDAEALRLIKGAPSWLPAAAKAAAIGQIISFPVSFEWKKE